MAAAIALGSPACHQTRGLQSPKVMGQQVGRHLEHRRELGGAASPRSRVSTMHRRDTSASAPWIAARSSTEAICSAFIDSILAEVTIHVKMHYGVATSLLVPEVPTPA